MYGLMHRREIRVKIHIVQKGDTLWKIAKKYGVNFEELKKMNSQLSNPDMIMPGMKIKVPTSGGMVKKEAPVGPTPESAIQLGAKKEMPTFEHPFAKEQPKPLPIVEAPKKEMPIMKEAPKKEMPIIKEAPKAPYVPKMPLPIIPEIDINNYYMMNMAQMNVQQPAPQPKPVPELPPKPVVLPEVKEAPKQELPVEVCPPIGVEQPMYSDYCIPVSPVMPGPGYIYPIDCCQVQPVLPYQQIPCAPMPMTPEMMPMTPEMMPIAPGVAPEVAGTSYIPPHYEDESSSFMPQMPMMNPGMGMQNPMAGTQPIQSLPSMQQTAAPTGQMPMGYQPMAAAPNPGYGEMAQGYPTGSNPGYGEMAQGYPIGMNPEIQAGYPASQYPQMPVMNPASAYPTQGMPSGYPQSGYPGYPTGMYAAYQPGPYYPGGISQQSYVNPAMSAPYGQMPYGYPQMGSYPSGLGAELESPSNVLAQTSGQPYPAQGQMPVGAGPMGDCGCGATPMGSQNFVPATPPIYSAPYTAPTNVGEPPYMNPYGMGPMGAASYTMPRYDDESNDY
jgi:morphogenetic protein associated with SpoVID